MLECERYEGARDRMLGLVTAEIGVEVWCEMGEWMEYLLGLCEERKMNGSVIEGVKDFLWSVWRKRKRTIEKRGHLGDGYAGHV